MKKILLLLVLSLILCGCSSITQEDEIEKIMSKNEYIIVDVRSEAEYRTSHISGAINIPYDQIDNNLDKTKTIFVYCMSGTRSKIAFNTLTNLGYDVYDLGAFSEIDLPKE